MGYSGPAVHSRDQASWSLISFLAFVLPISGADVIACRTELWRLGVPGIKTKKPNKLLGPR